MINLTGANSLVITLTDDPNIPLHAVVDFSDKGTAYDPADQKSRPNGTDPFEICAAPATGDVRSINRISVVNPNPESMAVTLSIYDGLDYFEIGRAVIGEGERVAWTHASDMKVNLADGSTKSGAVQDLSSYATHTEVAVVQDALDAHVADTSAAHAASAISNTPSGSIASTNVQAALNEIDGDLTSHTGNTSNPHSVTAAQAGAIALTDIDTDGTLAANSDVKVPSQKAVKTAINALLGANDAEVYKGVIDCSSNPNYPAADAGHVYRVSVAGKIGGASGVNVEIGDRLQCITDSTASGNQATVGANWWITQTNIDGAVVGPASATDAHVAVFDGATGKLIKDGGAVSALSVASAATLTTPRNIDGQAFNGSADITVIAPGTHAATGKATPVDADELPLVDSAASNVLKKLTWANLKATLKTYFDTLYAAVGNYLKYDTTATVSVGYNVTAFSAGTKSSGTFTPDPASGNYQYLTNGGAFTLAAPASDCGIALHVLNNGSAGAITFSGFTVGSNVGDALTTTNTHKFRIRIERINSVATYSVQALQ